MSDKKLYCCVIACFVLLAAAESDSLGETENEKKRQAALETKVQKLTEWSGKDGIIRLTGERYKKYIKESPRNYSMIVMLTALKPHRQCDVCVEAKDEYQIVADSWRYSRHWSTGLFFSLVDFDEASDVFHKLQVNTVPMFIHFPAKGKPKKEDTMNREALIAERMAAWVHERSGVEIKVYRPINYTFWAVLLSVLTISGGLLYFLRNKLHHLFSRTFLAVPILIVIFAQISGYMWNQIRSPPNMYKDRSGKPIYIHPSRDGQLVFETYIMMLLYSSMLVGFIMLNEVNSLQKLWCRRILALAGLAFLLVFFCILLNVFKTKSPYYPYGFFDLVNDYVWKINK